MTVASVLNGQFFCFDGKHYVKLANMYFNMEDFREVGFHADCGITSLVGNIACVDDNVVRTFYGKEYSDGKLQTEHNLGDEIVVCCHFCNTKVPHVTEAIEQGWLPDFWDDEQVPEPVCPECQKIHLYFDEENGDYAKRELSLI